MTRLHSTPLLCTPSLLSPRRSSHHAPTPSNPHSMTLLCTPSPLSPCRSSHHAPTPSNPHSMMLRRTALDTDVALGANTPYALEALGTTSAAGNNAQTVSATREDFASSAIAALRSEVAELRSTVSSRAPRLLRGSGSSAVSLFMWRTMDAFAAKSTSPVWMTYRATGSGTGESEIVGSPAGSTAATEFGCSDVGLASTSYISLVAAGAKLVHVPILIAPVSFFVNIPTDVMPKPQNLRLSSCTIAQMFMVRTFNRADIHSWCVQSLRFCFHGGCVGMAEWPARRMRPGSSSIVNSQRADTFSNQLRGWALGLCA
eukprot:363711-Chlamydomonas_euryale.AAC.11